MQEILSVYPEHLSSLRAICEKFKKSRKSVMLWREEGAPIAHDGIKYCAEYNQLQNWLVNRSR